MEIWTNSYVTKRRGMNGNGIALGRLPTQKFNGENIRRIRNRIRCKKNTTSYK